MQLRSEINGAENENTEAEVDYRNKVVELAKALISDGKADRVLGWSCGEFFYDVTPAVFESAQKIDECFVYDGFCGANLSKYLVNETKKTDGANTKKVAVFLKPCDTYSFNQLLTEHRFERDRVYCVGISCGGMLDINKIKNSVDFPVGKIEADGSENITVCGLFGDRKTVKRTDVLLSRCLYCKGAANVEFDETAGDCKGIAITGADRFDEVRQLENMTAEQRYAFWQRELSRCIRCNACRDVCPACTCEKCVFGNTKSGIENKAASDPFEEKLFHIIRAFHVAGRCTDCGECSRVCPSHIPLHLLNRKFIGDIDRLFGEYQAGAEVGTRSPVTAYSPDDAEPYEAVNGGDRK